MEVTVGQSTYRVEIDPTEIENGNCGTTYHQSGVIRLRPNMSDGEYRDTLLHEVRHAVAHFVGIGDEDKLSEEEWITRTNPALLDVLCKNPELRRVLFNET